MSIGIRELRQNASQYVALVKHGERVAVTERGKLVAYLVPADDSGTGILDRLAAAGEYTPPTRSIADLLPPLEPPPGATPLSEVVLSMREDDRG